MPEIVDAEIGYEDGQEVVRMTVEAGANGTRRAKFRLRSYTRRVLGANYIRRVSNVRKIEDDFFQDTYRGTVVVDKQSRPERIMEVLSDLIPSFRGGG
jgi:hypothetical protein